VTGKRIVAAALVVAFLLTFVDRWAWVLVAVLAAVLIWEQRAQIHTWWDRVIITRLERWTHPKQAVWSGPPANPDHATLRSDYEAVAAKPRPSRGDLLHLAEVTDGLLDHGDNPLSAPPTIRRQAFAGFMSAGSIIGGSLSQWTLIGGAGLLAACAVLYARGDVLKAARDKACTVNELRGHTTREPCVALSHAGSTIANLQADLEDIRHNEAVALQNQVASALETGRLNQRMEARRAAAAAIERRAHEDEVLSARDARAPDWDSRLRDVGAGSPVLELDPLTGAPASAGPAGGVPTTGAAPASVPDPHAAAPTG
jgi:hypothetical protein